MNEKALPKELPALFVFAQAIAIIFKLISLRIDHIISIVDKSRE